MTPYMLSSYANDCSCGYIIAYESINDNMKVSEKFKFIGYVFKSHESMIKQEIKMAIMKEKQVYTRNV